MIVEESGGRAQPRVAPYTCYYLLPKQIIIAVVQL
jgi:hypothetical protein